MIPGHCDHIGLLTARIEPLLDFYRTLLGFEVVKDEVIGSEVMESIFGVPGDCRLVKLSRPGTDRGAVVIELFSYIDAVPVARPPGTAGYHHWGLRVGDREAFVASLKQRGVPVTEVPRESHRVYFISDPDGNMIEIRT